MERRANFAEVRAFLWTLRRVYAPIRPCAIIFARLASAPDMAIRPFNLKHFCMIALQTPFSPTHVPMFILILFPVNHPIVHLVISFHHMVILPRTLLTARSVPRQQNASLSQFHTFRHQNLTSHLQNLTSRPSSRVGTELDEQRPSDRIKKVHNAFVAVILLDVRGEAIHRS